MKTLITFFIGVVLTCATAQAEDSYVVYEDIDFNADGWISPDEAVQRADLAENWHQIDTNNDGLISSMEYLKYESLERYGLPYEAQDMDPGAAPL